MRSIAYDKLKNGDKAFIEYLRNYIYDNCITKFVDIHASGFKLIISQLSDEIIESVDENNNIVFSLTNVSNYTTLYSEKISGQQDWENNPIKVATHALVFNIYFYEDGHSHIKIECDFEDDYTNNYMQKIIDNNVDDFKNLTMFNSNSILDLIYDFYVDQFSPTFKRKEGEECKLDVTNATNRIFNNKLKQGFSVTDVRKEFTYLLSEVHEAMDAFDKHDRVELGTELADSAIYILSLAKMLGYDIEHEIMNKLKINEARIYKKLENGDFVKIKK